MGVSFGGLSAPLRGVKAYERAFERAAERMVASSMPEAAAAEGPVASLPNAVVDMIVAQRMHTASLRALETAHEMLREVLELGE